MRPLLGLISTCWLIFMTALLSQVVSTSSNTARIAAAASTTTLSSTTTTVENATEAAIEETTVADLDKAESKDAKNFEIIKQIRRVNNDGSYTVGYEADDGTFKIESRDVLGNVKGTYGYVDQNGEIKRISYTANNATNDLKSTMATTEEDAEVVHIPRQNRTVFVPSTTRRPSSVAYSTSTAAPARTNTAKATIPKRRILLSAANRVAHKNLYSSTLRKSESSTASSSARKTDPTTTTTIVFATSVPRERPTKASTAATKSLPNLSSTTTMASVTDRSSKVEITGRISKVLNMNKDRVTEKPVTESIDEEQSQTERKPVRGNFLRRQLPDDTSEQYEAQQQVVYSSQTSGEDSDRVFGGTVRPFSTTSSPRIPALVLAARSRAAQLKQAQLAQSNGASERVYAKPPRRKQERRGGDDDEPNTEPTSENTYLTQSPIPVQIPANRDPSQASEDEQRIYRRPANFLPRTQSGRHYRVPIHSQAAPSAAIDYENEQQQYLRETTDPNLVKNSVAAAQEHYANGEANAINPSAFVPRYPRPYPLNTYDGQQQHQQHQQPQAQQSYPHPLPISPFQRQPPPYDLYGPNNLDRPLTARDFERLLNMLVQRYHQFQRQNYFGGQPPYNPYLFGGMAPPFAPQYNPYGGYQQIPRPPLYHHQYDPRYGGYRQSPLSQSPFYPYTEQENSYGAQNPIPVQQQQQQQQPNAQFTGGQRVPPRRKAYNLPYALYNDRPAEYDGDESQQSLQQASSDYLPSDVREELLYRMLMLAIQPENVMSAANAPIPEASTMQEYVKSTASSIVSTTSAPASTKESKKPIRSVQILGEE